jgi:hypothetical protein
MTWQVWYRRNAQDPAWIFGGESPSAEAARRWAREAHAQPMLHDCPPGSALGTLADGSPVDCTHAGFHETYYGQCPPDGPLANPQAVPSDAPRPSR